MRIRSLNVIATYLLAALATAGVIALQAPQAAPSAPRFEDYPAGPMFMGPSAVPILTTAEERKYRTWIERAMRSGLGVWNGNSQNPSATPGPNFAARYVVIRWGCGSNCLMMAIVDAKSGEVYPPPLSGVGTELFVPIDPTSAREIDFRPDSTLMVLRDACTDFRNRSTCGKYYLNWKDKRFTTVKFVPATPPKER